jgi:hypothetical protein
MSIPIHAGTYRLEWNIATGPSPSGSAIPGDNSKDSAWLSNARSLLGSFGRVLNGYIQTLGTGGLNGYNHRLIVIMTVNRQVLWSELDTAAVNAYKQAYDRGISTTQFVRVLNESSFSAFPFGILSIYKGAFHTRAGASETSSAAPQYTTTERVLQPTISSSTDITTVGNTPPPVDVSGAIKGLIESGSNLATIPTGYKVAGVAILTLAGLAVLGYAYRSVK